MKTKENKTTVFLEHSYKDFLLAAKQLCRNEGIKHITGLAESPMLLGKATEDEMKAVVDHAINKGVFYGNNSAGYRIEPILHAFIENYAHSKNIVSLHKPSFGQEKLISFAHCGDVFLCLVMDSKKDKVTCLADRDIHRIYAYLKEELDKKDPDKAFSIKKANKRIADEGADWKFELKPENRIALCTTANADGKSLEKEVVLHIQKEEYEYITARPEFKVVARKGISSMEADIIAYITDNCPPDNDDPAGPDEPDDTDQDNNDPSKIDRAVNNNDPENFTRLSFASLTGSPSFPKSTSELIGAMFKNLKKSFTKESVIRTLIQLLISFVLLTLWNIYGACYLNDTFRLRTSNSVFGGLTPYLLFGEIADKNKGLEFFTRNQGWKHNTLLLNTSVYVLLNLIVRTVISDIKGKKIGSVLKSTFGFRKIRENYKAAALVSPKQFFFISLIVASFLNILVYNPVSVFLLALILIASGMRADNSNLSSVIMVAQSASRYKKINSGRKTVPMYSHIQLGVLYTGYGLLISTVINTLLWFLLDFKIIPRIVISAIVIIYSVVQLTLIKKDGNSDKGKPGSDQSKAIAQAVYFLLTVGTSLLLAASYCSMILADDGGWTESGKKLIGLIRNSGFPYVLGISLAAAAVAAISAIIIAGTGGLALAAIAGVAGLGTAAWASRDDNYKVAANLLLGDKSEFADDPVASLKADLIDTAIAFIPVVGDVVGVAEGVRDVTYDAFDQDAGAFAWDLAGLGFSICGLNEASKLKGAGKLGEKFAENVADAATGGDIGKVVRAANEIDANGGLLKSAGNVISDLKNTGDYKKLINNGLDAVETGMGAVDQANQIVDSAEDVIEIVKEDLQSK